MVRIAEQGQSELALAINFNGRLKTKDGLSLLQVMLMYKIARDLAPNPIFFIKLPPLSITV